MRAVDLGRLFLLAALWGGSFLFMRIAAPVLGSFSTAFLRVFFGFLGLLLILFIFRRKISFEGKFKSSLILGIINSGIPFFMYCVAAQYIPAGYSSTLNATTPLMGAVVGVCLFHEKLSPKRWCGVVLGIFGIGLITAVGDANTSDKAAVGVFACLVATFCYGLAGFLTRRWITNRGGLDPKLVAFGSQLGASIFLMPFFGWSVLNEGFVDWWRADVWTSVIAVGFLCTSVAYILYFRLISDIGPLRSLTVTFLIPPFGVLWGYLVLGETITKGFVFGSIVVLFAVILVVVPDRSTA
ncbi:multidrug DMT transporter permease [Pseudomonas oryzihabitans]|nr:multidrug DMT transporter permease [Pseudomonas psychrotolerans]